MQQTAARDCLSASLPIPSEPPESYYRARYYDQTAGRFLSEDPVEFQGGINFYRYAINSPVVLRDPSGLCPPVNDICKSLIFQPMYLTIFSNMGKHLNVDPHFIMAVAVHESGWNLIHVFGTNKSSHGKPLNNLFGTTYAGRDNIAYPSVGASADAWEKNWGPELADHPSTIEDFTYDLTQNPKHMYNTDKGYPGLVEDLYRDLLRHLKDCNITLPTPKGD